MKDDVKVLIAIIRSLTVCSNKLNVDDSMTVVDDSMKLVPLMFAVLLIVNEMIDCNLYSTLSSMLEQLTFDDGIEQMTTGEKRKRYQCVELNVDKWDML